MIFNASLLALLASATVVVGKSPDFTCTDSPTVPVGDAQAAADSLSTGGPDYDPNNKYCETSGAGRVFKQVGDADVLGVPNGTDTTYSFCSNVATGVQQIIDECTVGGYTGDKLIVRKGNLD